MKICLLPGQLIHFKPYTVEVKNADGSVCKKSGVKAIAAKEDADMIVMGTHGRKGIDRILFGSVAERVVKNSHLPVLTIRPSDNYTGGAMYKD